MESANPRLLSREEMDMLIAFMRAHGRAWKAKLRAGWDKSDGSIPPILYALRNSHGPSWLAHWKGFKL